MARECSWLERAARTYHPYHEHSVPTLLPRYRITPRPSGSARRPWGLLARPWWLLFSRSPRLLLSRRRGFPRGVFCWRRRPPPLGPLLAQRGFSRRRFLSRQGLSRPSGLGRYSLPPRRHGFFFRPPARH